MVSAFWSELRYRLRAILRRGVLDRDLDDELRFHIEREAEKHVAQGLTRDEASRRARTKFGGREQIKEECRDVGRVNLIEDAWKDLRHGARGLRRSPGFAATMVLILALGIGAATAIFSVAYGVLLRSLPYEDPTQLVQLYTTDLAYEERWPLSPPQFMSLREQTRTFTDIAVYTNSRPPLTGRGEARWLDGAQVSAGFFEVMGAEPMLGRTFVEDENRSGSDDVVMISHALWQELGGESADVLGQTLTLYERPRVIVGVMPAGFDFPYNSDVWLPLGYDETFSATSVKGRLNFSFPVVGRLGDGVAPGDAQRELNLVADRIAEQFPREHNTRFTIDPLREVLVSSARTPLLLLVAAVGLLLLIACANVAGLLLARAAGRQEELAVRAAIGAGRGRLVRQLLTESLLIGAVGGALGLLLTMWATRLIVAAPPEGLPRLDAIRVDGAVLAFGLGVTLLTTLLVGLVPALQATGAAVASGLREGGRGRTGVRSSVHMRAGLVVAELALAVVLLSGAGLLMHSFVRMISTDPGFQTERVLTFQIGLPSTRYGDDDAQRSYYEDLLARIATLPGVESTGAVHRLPILQGGFYTHLMVEGDEPANPRDAPLVRYRSVSPGYFETMGIPVLRGRGITEQDRDGALRVVVINETAARDLFGGEDPVGQRFRTSQMAGFLTVVGITRDVPEDQPTHPPEPQIFWAFDQDPWSYMNVVVRSHGADPLTLAPVIRHTLRQVDADVLGRDFQTLERIVADSVTSERFLTALLVLFASAALLLASIGVFGLLSFTVAERTREIGVRIALGAMRREIMTLVLRDALKLAAAGLAIGLTGALLIGRLLEGLLYEVSPADPATIGTMTALLLLVALLASWLPARRAARVDPMTVLRHE